MIISARAHYASLAMLELALRRDDSGPVTASEITDRQQIPRPFLGQILRVLRTAGWVESLRGSQGGYRLVVDPAQVTLLEIAEAVGCQELGRRGEVGATPGDELLHGVWDHAAEAARQVLAETHLSDLVEQVRHGDATMFYI